ncbi:hypothetical protein EDE15_2379 [Edaphobacter aggregans]|uniref:Uncharacterized protein n=1 Tax=Edaphobacter aggregans TaxID=570835 RepID=A0A3R9P9T3_9BACT|nr:hypothetical protein EDE15_2379 [Edaphobacter aggregans]
MFWGVSLKYGLVVSCNQVFSTRYILVLQRLDKADVRGARCLKNEVVFREGGGAQVTQNNANLIDTPPPFFSITPTIALIGSGGG